MASFVRLIILTLLILSFSPLNATETILPLTQKMAATLVAVQSGDKVISTSIDKDNPALFRVKTLSKQGHIKTYRVDAHTGDILR